jgi:hypothetical protein
MPYGLGHTRWHSRGQAPGQPGGAAITRSLPGLTSRTFDGSGKVQVAACVKLRANSAVMDTTQLGSNGAAPPHHACHTRSTTGLLWACVHQAAIQAGQ